MFLTYSSSCVTRDAAMRTLEATSDCTASTTSVARGTSFSRAIATTVPLPRPPPSFSVDVPGLALVRSAPSASASCFCSGTTDDETAPRLRQPLHHQGDLRPPRLSSSLSSSASPTAHFKALRVSLAFTLRTVARNLRHRVFLCGWCPPCVVWIDPHMRTKDTSPYRCAHFFHNSSACDAGSLTSHTVAGSVFVACDARRDALTSALACARANDYDFRDHHVSEGVGCGAAD